MRLIVVGSDTAWAAGLARRLGLKVVNERPDVVLCHGGDGTLLRAEREWRGVPKVPVRVGSRARLCPEHGLEKVLAALTAGALERKELELLELRVGELRRLAVNDVVLRNDNPATAVRFRVQADGLDTGEVTGDGLVFSTPFGSSGYYCSITRQVLATGLGVAFNNATQARDPIVVAGREPVDVTMLRGLAVLVCDNDARGIPLRDGHRFQVRLSDERAVVLGLDSLGCQVCRKADGSPFNPH
jgi:NAD+ kinase